MGKGKLYRVLMHFTTPLHIGEKEKIYNITQTFAHSDMLMSGIINAYSLLYGNSSTNQLVESFLSEKSAF